MTADTIKDLLQPLGTFTQKAVSEAADLIANDWDSIMTFGSAYYCCGKKLVLVSYDADDRSIRIYETRVKAAATVSIKLEV